LGDLDLAEQYVIKAMEINKKNNNQLLYASSILNLANVKFAKKKYTEAIDLTKQAIEIFHKSQQITSECRSYINMLEMYRQMGEKNKGSEIAKKVMSFEKVLEEPAEKIHLYQNLAVFFEETKDYEKAYLYKDLQMDMNDSLFALDLTKQATELETKYAAEKKEKENELLSQKFELEHQKVEVEHAQSMQHKIMLYFSIPLVLFFILMAVILFRQNKVKQKANSLLNQKNLIIEEKSKIVEEQNKDITDSIRYAQRIQAAILPPDKLWYSILPDSFVLYRPKDILSGDFYWVEETEHHIFFAAADCTGHGVPGALMSVVNFNLLNKAALEKNIVKPDEILNAVNEWLTGSLHQTFQESTVKDGMDIAVCVIDKKTKQFHFAGANNPMYIIANGQIKIIAGDKFPVGAFIEEQRRSFTNNVFPITGNETVYIFSDGYADQFGGPKGKKFKYKPFQEKILSIQNLTLQKQKHELLKTFEDWKGDLEQIDDVLVVGVKLYTI
ncbi:MAG: SpoIIE family protein phosphatase, partial [Bacteroidia bacterium]|nr:SpoIIE family protein phosphatase [Bacteroidia bacterium]